jgi:hypothetical protein
MSTHVAMITVWVTATPPIVYAWEQCAYER